MAKIKTMYVCQECGKQYSKWVGKCNECNQWDTIIEETYSETTSKQSARTKSVICSERSVKLSEVNLEEYPRIKTGISELDKVLGGGIVKGSMILIGGSPGIGKSTLILQICEAIGKQERKIQYFSGEESTSQIKMRADRLNVTTENLSLKSETNVDTMIDLLKIEKPEIAIVDSIQTMYSDEIQSAAGSVSQVRECTHKLMNVAKGLNISLLIIGHVTKDGNLAGPRVLEHMVDTVLYFEGDKGDFRILRSVKNRFGGTDMGVFTMEEKGLMEVKNPSEFLLKGRPTNTSGSVISCVLEGSRPMLLEVQSLTPFTSFGLPRRTATGMDFNRLIIILAVLEKKIGLQLGSYDVYANLTGGIKITETALDLGIAIAIASSFKNFIVDPKTIVFGEIGLTGEVRSVSMAEKRIQEAINLGFSTCIMPKSNAELIKKTKGINIIGVKTVKEAIDYCRDNFTKEEEVIL